MAGQYTSQAHGCLFQKIFQTPAVPQLRQTGRQEANVNFEANRHEGQKPSFFIEFSIDSENLGA
jgi:hypothetical protein